MKKRLIKGEKKMKTLIFNESNLQENDIDEVVTRVKVFLVNNKNELNYAISNGGVQLPGGHVEIGEDYVETVKREIKEEVGIELEDKEISKPFFEIKHYTKNYSNSNKNRISNVLYYFVHTDKNVNLKNTSLTDNEKKNKFIMQKIDCNLFEDYLSKKIAEESIEINKIIEKEILIAYKELNQMLF